MTEPVNEAEVGVDVLPMGCPVCFTKLDRVACVSERGRHEQPREGDFSFCIECGATLRHNADGTLHAFTEEERMQLTPQDRNCLLMLRTRFQKALRDAKAKVRRR